MFDEIDVRWEDGSYWGVSWFREAGCYFAQRWFPEDDEDRAEGPFIESPGPETALVEDLGTLEAVMGRPLPTDTRAQLQAVSEHFPFTDEMRASWGEAVAFGITRLHPSGEWIETFAPPRDPNPFAHPWLPEWMQ